MYIFSEACECTLVFSMNPSSEVGTLTPSGGWDSFWLATV